MAGCELCGLRESVLRRILGRREHRRAGGTRVLAGIALGAAAAFFVGSILLESYPVTNMDDHIDDGGIGDAMKGVPGVGA